MRVIVETERGAVALRRNADPTRKVMPQRDRRRESDFTRNAFDRKIGCFEQLPRALDASVQQPLQRQSLWQVPPTQQTETPSFPSCTGSPD